MIKLKSIKIYIEDEKACNRRIDKELDRIDKGLAKTLSEDSISFKSLDQFRKIMTPKRLELLKTIRHQKPDSIYALAKLVKRTPENVNTDIKFLKQLGFVQVTKVKDKRKKSVPRVNYDKITWDMII